MKEEPFFSVCAIYDENILGISGCSYGSLFVELYLVNLIYSASVDACEHMASITFCFGLCIFHSLVCF